MRKTLIDLKPGDLLFQVENNGAIKNHVVSSIGIDVIHVGSNYKFSFDELDHTRHMMEIKPDSRKSWLNKIDVYMNLSDALKYSDKVRLTIISDKEEEIKNIRKSINEMYGLIIQSKHRQIEIAKHE